MGSRARIFIPVAPWRDWGSCRCRATAWRRS
jgi:hypothetical protein